VSQQLVPKTGVVAWSISAFEVEREAALVEPLLLASAADSAAGPKLSLAGLHAELASRPDRMTAGFVARAPHAAADVVGLAIVVEASAAGRRRFSLSWLLVHPAVRRQGVATALLAHACDHVRARGGAEISAETLDSWPAAVAFWQTLNRKP
jgi:GNAT superfamily N-acetyltransferase